MKPEEKIETSFVSDDEIEQVLSKFIQTRHESEEYCRSLEIEDYSLQAIVETSPAKWHLAHTSWFFETFILKEYESNFAPFNVAYEMLFNSYYNSVGEQFPRSQRGLLSRPTVEEVYRYREDITQRIINILHMGVNVQSRNILTLLTLGINHEQQHQELFFTDLKYNFYQNPLYPAYREVDVPDIKVISPSTTQQQKWLKYQGGLIDIGINHQHLHTDEENFNFDNEEPKHQQWLQPFEVSNRLVTNGEYIMFIEQGGYQKPSYWLSDGWSKVLQEQWQAPLYWKKMMGKWHYFTLNGMKEVNMNEPVSHISAYEADAYARWCNARLLTEFEWEHVAKLQHNIAGNFVESKLLKACHATTSEGISQLYGDLWEWTSSAYSPYPGFVASEGAVGEYNGKFMCNQLVLKGGSCVTSSSHIRASYRNFFYPETRWQFSGIRLARYTD